MVPQWNAFQPKVFRQTILSFKPLGMTPAVSAFNNSRSDTKLVRYAGELPAEVLYTIFESLRGHTYVLKCVRLVCRYWARLSTEFLFSIAYLDNYKSSWKRLIQLCLSPYASSVKQIQWNPLVMYEDCLDADTWRYNYPNTLQHANHSVIEQLHDAYCHTYRQAGMYGRLEPSDMDALTEVLFRLCSCRELCLNDDTDFESSCADMVTSKRLQNDSTIWKTTTMWARIPRVVGGRTTPQKCSILDILSLLTYLDTVTHLTMDLWEPTWEPTIYEYTIGRSLQLLSITSLHLNLKSCRLGSEEYDATLFLNTTDGRISRPSTISQIVSLFPNIRTLFLGTTYNDPGITFVDTAESDRLEGEELDASFVDYVDRPESVPAATSFAELEERSIEKWPSWVTPPMLSAHLAPFDLHFIRNSKLSDVSLSNMSIDLRCLTFWLIESHKRSRLPVKLRFSGYVFLHNLKQNVFLAVLEKLGIQLSCHPDTNFCHGDLSFEFQRKMFSSLSQSSGNDLVLHDLYTWPNDSECGAVPELHPSASWGFDEADLIYVDFADYPHDWRDLKMMNSAMIRETGASRSFLYCYSESPSIDRQDNKVHRIVFQWIDKAIYDRSPAHTPLFHTLMRLDLQYNRWWEL